MGVSVGMGVSASASVSVRNVTKRMTNTHQDEKLSLRVVLVVRCAVDSLALNCLHTS